MQVRQNVLYRSMLSRRQLRVKVYKPCMPTSRPIRVTTRLQAVSCSVRSKVHELYIYLLSLLRELADSDQADADDLHLKFSRRRRK